MRDSGACIARADEAEIGLVAHDANAVDVGEPLRCRLGRGVVDDNDLERNSARVLGERAQTRGRVIDLVEHRNHDRHARRAGCRHGEIRKVLARRRVRHARTRRTLAAQLARDPRQRTGDAALRETAAHAREHRAHVQRAECKARAHTSDASVRAAERSGDAPRSAGQHLFEARLEIAQFRIERLRPARALGKLAIERVAPVAAAFAFRAHRGKIMAQRIFVFAKVRNRCRAFRVAQ